METSSKKSFIVYLPLMVLMLTQIGTSSDNTILSIATTSLISALHVNLSDITVTNMVYSLCAGAFMITGGMIGIIIGWKKNLQLGMALAAIGELILAVSSNIVMFTWAGRLIVGIGASFMIPSVLGLIPAIYQGKMRIFAFGAIGAATGMAFIIGPIVAGMLLDAFGFRFAFGIMALYFFIILIGTKFIPKTEKASNKISFDALGMVVAAFGLFLFLIGISKISEWGLITPIHPPFTVCHISPSLPLSILGILILIILIFMEKQIEAKKGSALLPSSFINTPQVIAGLLASATSFLYLGGVIMLVNPYLQLVGGFSAVQTGIAMISLGFPMFFASMGVPKLLPDMQPKTALRIGYVLLLVSVFPVAASFQPNGVNALLYVGMFIGGIGQGFMSAQANNVVASAVNQRDAQQSGGIQATARSIGQAVGVAILGMVMIFTINSNIDHQMNTSTAITPQTRMEVNARNITFMSDKDFEKSLSDLQMSTTEKQTLIAMNAKARVSSTRLAEYILGLLSILGIGSTRFIKKNRKE